MYKFHSSFGREGFKYRNEDQHDMKEQHIEVEGHQIEIEDQYHEVEEQEQDPGIVPSLRSCFPPIL